MDAVGVVVMRVILSSALLVEALEDYEYERRGVRNLFLVCEPLRAGAT